MKRIITLTFFIVTTLFPMSSRLHAQVGALRATVPFAFAIGNKMLPPGEYEIERRGAFVRFQNRDRKCGSFAIPMQGDISNDGWSRLLFDRQNDHYFLRKIATPSSVTSVEFPKSKRERQVQEFEYNTSASSER
jgi:hypothetical protein